MADPMPKSDRPLSERSQKLLLTSCNRIVTNFASHASELRSKMEVIDIAYARYKSKKKANGENGTDHGYDVRCDSEFDELRERFTEVDIPLLVSQVDTAVGYLADLYLSGYPIFPVVSEPNDREQAEYIEALVDKHATLGKYPAELLKFFWDTAKYNFAPMQVEWDYLRQFIRASDFDAGLEGKPLMNQEEMGYTAIRRLDPYNTIYDLTVNPGEAASKGDYAGFVEQLTPTRLQRLIEKLETMPGHLMNRSKVFESSIGESQYFSHPQVSEYITTRSRAFSWEDYFSDKDTSRKTTGAVTPGMHEVVTLYRRLVPEDYMMPVPDDYKKRLRIYKIVIVDQSHVLYVEPVYSAMEHLPILIGAPKDDGLGLQTQSTAESIIPMQNAASALVNIRFHAARRAINDRAIFDEDMIDRDELDNPSPSAKIAAKRNSLSQRKLGDAYFSIPYDPRGTDAVLRDALLINDWTNELSGMNRAQQGQFQKGNKTQSEFSTVMSNAEMRQRLPAIMLEHQVFIPLKQMIKLNIFRYARSEAIRSQATGRTVETDLAELNQNIFDFRIADGYLPKNKLASSDMLTAGMQMIQSSEVLQQAYGMRLPQVLAHMMTLGGVRGFEQYTPPEQPALPAGPAGAPPAAPAAAPPQTPGAGNEQQ